jgi:hypothetical protein
MMSERNPIEEVHCELTHQVLELEFHILSGISGECCFRKFPLSLLELARSMTD